MIQSMRRTGYLSRRFKGQACPATGLVQCHLWAEPHHFRSKGPRARLFALKLPARRRGQNRPTAPLETLGKKIGGSASRICIIQPDIGQTRAIRAIGKDCYHWDLKIDQPVNLNANWRHILRL